VKKLFKIFIFLSITIIFYVFIVNSAYQYFSNRTPAEKYALANLTFAKSIANKNVKFQRFYQGAYYGIMYSNTPISPQTTFSNNIYISFAQALKVRKQINFPLTDTIDKLNRISNQHTREMVASELCFMSMFAKDYDATISIMNYSRKDYAWFTMLTFVYFNSEKKDFIIKDKLISKNLRHFKNKNDLNSKDVWDMVCSMPHLLIGGFYKSSSETAVLAFDDYKRYKNRNICDFSKSIKQFHTDYKSRRTSESAKVLSGLLYLSGQTKEALNIVEKINSPSAKINAISLIINLAIFNDDIKTAEMLAEKLSTLNKIKMYFFL